MPTIHCSYREAAGVCEAYRRITEALDVFVSQVHGEAVAGNVGEDVTDMMVTDMRERLLQFAADIDLKDMREICNEAEGAVNDYHLRAKSWA